MRIFFALVDDGVLIMNPRLDDLVADAMQLGPSVTLEALQVGSGHSDRQIIRAGPGRSVFDVIVARHVLSDDGDFEVRMFGQHKGGCEAHHASAARRL